MHTLGYQSHKIYILTAKNKISRKVIGKLFAILLK